MYIVSSYWTLGLLRTVLLSLYSVFLHSFPVLTVFITVVTRSIIIFFNIIIVVVFVLLLLLIFIRFSLIITVMG